MAPFALIGFGAKVVRRCPHISLVTIRTDNFLAMSSFLNPPAIGVQNWIVSSLRMRERPISGKGPLQDLASLASSLMTQGL